jgi:hypothetical protein
MKASAYIFSAFFVLLFGYLQIQPVLPKQEVKKEQSCAKKNKCHKQKESPCQKKQDCNNDGCNPFEPCATGGCCYLVENFFSNLSISFVQKQRITLSNDNRLLNKLSECWHPPEVLS